MYMGHKLSIGKYAGLCVLGGEIAYSACLVFGSTLTGESAELHHALLGLLPGFTWFSIGSYLAGAVSIAIWSGIGGAFVAWMHNVSLEK